jgi:hypothetical protein
MFQLKKEELGLVTSRVLFLNLLLRFKRRKLEARILRVGAGQEFSSLGYLRRVYISIGDLGSGMECLIYNDERSLFKRGWATAVEERDSGVSAGRSGGSA